MGILQRFLACGVAVLLITGIGADTGFGEREPTEQDLFRAIRKGDAERVRAFLAAGVDIHAKQAYGRAGVLHVAAGEGQLGIAVLLLNRGADPNARTTPKAGAETPLHWAAAHGHTEFVELLILARADLNPQTSSDKKTPLHAAARNGHAGVIQTLLHAGAEVDAKTSDGNTPLHMAAYKNKPEAARALIEGGADLEAAEGVAKRRPLHIAVVRGHMEVVEVLLEAKADVHALVQPLFSAAYHGHIGTAKLLIQYGADPNRFVDKKRTPLYAAVNNGHLELVEYLIEKGGKVDLVPLPILVRSGSIDLVKRKLKSGEDINAGYGEKGFTPLIWAAKDGLTEMAEFLIESGAKVNKGADANPKSTRDNRMTALHQAASGNYEDLIELLLDHGADVNAKAWEGWTPLARAARRGHLEAAEILVDHGANVNAIDEKKNTPLLHVIKKAPFDTKGSQDHIITEEALEFRERFAGLVELLLDNGADPNIRGWSNRTALHEAIRSRNQAIVELLIEKGADVNLRSGSKDMPLHMAAHFGNVEAVRALLENGAAVHSKDKNGKTALDRAVARGAKRHVALIRAFIKDPEDLPEFDKGEPVKGPIR